MSLKNLDINLLVVFQKIYEVRSVSRTANALDVKQSTVSNSLARLRNRFDDPLFVRTGTGVSPTPIAEGLAPQINQILESLQKLGNSSENFNPMEDRRNFKLLIADPLEPIVLPRIIEQIPLDGGITIELVPPQIGGINDLILDGGAELAVFLPGDRHISLATQPICELDIVAVARKDHPALGKQPYLDVVRNYGFVTLNLRDRALPNAEKFKFVHTMVKKDVILTYKLSSIPPLLENSDLISFLPRLYAEHAANKFGIQLHPLPMKIPRQPIHMTWHVRNTEDSALSWLRNVIEASLKEQK